MFRTFIFLCFYVNKTVVCPFQHFLWHFSQHTHKMSKNAFEVVLIHQSRSKRLLSLQCSKNLYRCKKWVSFEWRRPFFDPTSRFWNMGWLFFSTKSPYVLKKSHFEIAKNRICRHPKQNMRAKTVENDKKTTHNTFCAISDGINPKNFQKFQKLQFSTKFCKKSHFFEKTRKTKSGKGCFTSTAVERRTNATHYKHNPLKHFWKNLNFCVFSKILEKLKKIANFFPKTTTNLHSSW